MKKLICVLLLIALCLPFAAAEENPYAFMEIPFDKGIDEYLPQLVEIYGGELPEYTTFMDSVYCWNDSDKMHLGRMETYKPENMKVGGYTVDSVDLIELAGETDRSLRKMAYIQLNYDVLPGMESEVYDRICADIAETRGEGWREAQESQWVTEIVTQWSINETRFLAAELWISKRNGSCRLTVYYGENDFDWIAQMVDVVPQV